LLPLALSLILSKRYRVRDFCLSLSPIYRVREKEIERSPIHREKERERRGRCGEGERVSDSKLKS
jgi:hypothetical protein